ncbi:TetR/AcrR family transcriptional regulator [Streptomyces sp. NP160]|uniref:TetR/AcrR family transcriptional regulator n=1 Tax=Streptomyces sp. NP160 TaxID=2586637 RepID=UPI001119F2BB|nr:TetR/AcrR family transcriptional regulator [Streptomyces sp. NP160]TNM59623.1 TetR/AcrR family transcriptional regulator [Streptomyces sp. NP160]
MAVSQEELLDRVAGLLAARPAASMEELAQAGGVSRATLFRRYSSREELVSALCHRAVERFVTATDFLDGEGVSARSTATTTSDADSTPDGAEVRLRLLVQHLAPLGALYGVLSTQPLQELLEVDLLASAQRGEQRIRDLVRRGQREGAFRIDVDPDWVLTALTWLLVGASDGVRLGRLAPARTGELVLDALERLLRP